MYGGQCTEGFWRSSMQLAEELTANAFPYTWFSLTNESLITRGRNICAAEFLNSDFSHMMFIDADIEFTPDDVGKLWAMQEEFAVGVYPMKKPGARYAAWHADELITDLDQFDGPICVDYAGTGFMLLSRYVFEKLAADSPDIVRYEEGQVGEISAFFQDPIDGGIHLSEDYFFCQQWRIYGGGNIWMDPTVRLKHIGTYTYDGT